MGGEPDDVRRLRPRLRAAALRGQREQGAVRREGSQHGHERGRLAAREQRERVELRRRDDRPREGVLGRRDDPDLRQPDAARRASPTRPSAQRRSTAFQNLTDPAHPGKQVIMKIMKKEELRERRRLRLAASEPQRRRRRRAEPPYQSDAGTNGQAIALSHFFGQHGYLPNYVDLPDNINMHATFVLGGPGIKHKDNVKGLRAIDVAPTLAFLMDIPGPQNARGRILYDLVEDAEQLHEVTILDISDYHGQLIPLAEASDTLGPTHSASAARRSSRRGSTRTRRRRRIERRQQEAERHRDGGRRLVRRRDAADLELLRRQADDRDHEHDGHRHRRSRQPQLRPRRRLPADGADPAGGLPVRLVERRRRRTARRRPEWSPSKMFKFAQRRQGRLRRLHERSTSRR